MTLVISRTSLVVLIVFSAVALGIPHAALAQAPFASQVENPPADAQKTASGLAYKEISPGSGSVRPTDADMVKIASSLWTKDRPQDKPLTFGPPTTPILMSGISLPGLKEGLALMTTGQKMRFWIPEKLAFAGAKDKPKGPIMADVVLLDVTPAPATPPDVAAPPADATTTKSGLAYKVLKPGTGAVHPKSGSKVMVHYTGWTTKGQIFDSSVTKGRPITFTLDEVIKGWTEGVQLMVEGQTSRFWIPGKLAYDNLDQPNTPKGMLVFEIQLLSIEAY